MIKRKWSALTWLFWLLIVFACEQERPSQVVFALFDLSGSTRNEATRERYFEQFKTIVEALSPDDRIIADNITDSPLAQSTFPINNRMKAFNALSDNKLVYEKLAQEAKAGILKQAQALLFDFERKVPSTKILESLLLAERVFTTYPEGRKALVIFSDMVEESESYNFTRENLTASRIQAIISQNRSRGVLPELGGVKVTVVGASAGGYEKMASRRTTAIRDFWLAYFTACSADLTRQRYGGALLGWAEG